MDKRERYLGCLMGLAVGDALGTTLEFRPPGSFTPINHESALYVVKPGDEQIIQEPYTGSSTVRIAGSGGIPKELAGENL